jgi:hypothetical protein
MAQNKVIIYKTVFKNTYLVALTHSVSRETLLIKNEAK